MDEKQVKKIRVETDKEIMELLKEVSDMKIDDKIKKKMHMDLKKKHLDMIKNMDMAVKNKDEKAMKIVKDIAGKIPSDFEQAQKQAEKVARGSGDKVKEEFEKAKKKTKKTVNKIEKGIKSVFG